jgi:hypothetical protein
VYAAFKEILPVHFASKLPLIDTHIIKSSANVIFIYGDTAYIQDLMAYSVQFFNDRESLGHDFMI